MGWSLATFITKYNGKKVGDGQCVALMRRYLEERFGSRYHGIPNVGGAEEIWDVADRDIWSSHGRASGYIPTRDALLIIRGHPGQENGHVAIVRDDSDRYYINSFDQNWSHKLRCNRERHRLDRNIIGYLVAKR